MTFGALLRVAGITVAAIALLLLIEAVAKVPIALFYLVIVVLGLGAYCVGCLIPEPVDDPDL